MVLQDVGIVDVMTYCCVIYLIL